MPELIPEPTPDLSDGTVITGAASKRMYVIYGGAKFLIPDPALLNSLGLAQAPHKIVLDIIIERLPSIPQDGTMLREVSSAPVYIVYAQVKLWIPDTNTFAAWGFQWSDVKLVPDSALQAIPNGPTAIPYYPAVCTTQNTTIPTPILNTLFRPGPPPTVVLPNDAQAFEVLPIGSVIALLAIPPSGSTGSPSIEVTIDGAALVEVGSMNIPVQQFLLAKNTGYYTRDTSGRYRVTITFPPGKANSQSLVLSIKNKLVNSTNGQASVSSALNLQIASQTAVSAWLSRVTQNNQVEFIIDGEGTFPRLDQAIAAAQKNIFLLQLSFDPTCESEFTCAETVAQRALLAMQFLQANRRGVPTRVLLDALDIEIKLKLFGFLLFDRKVNVSFLTELTAFFQQWGNNTVRIAGFPLAEPERLHAKALMIDHQESFILGLPFQQAYWDSSHHWVEDSRRGQDLESGNNKPPVHTVTLGIKGPAVAHVEELFTQLWNFRDTHNNQSQDQLVPASAPSSSGTQTLQIVRTISSDMFLGEEGILEAYKQAIAKAKHFIYLEQQYFTCRPIMDALKQAMDNNPSLQVILLCNVKPDIPPYEFWQDFRLLNTLGFPRPQLGVFTLWSMRITPGNPTLHDLQNCYVESKVAIIDDNWATIGTANLDGMSLQGMWDAKDGDVAQAMARALGQYGDASGTAPFRSMEINAVLLDGIEGQPQTGNVMSLRRTLWAEHLGPLVNVATPPAGGWLALWKSVAAANVASLCAQTPRMNGHILPYTPIMPQDPKKTLLGEELTLLQIQALGISTSRFNVFESGAPQPVTGLDARFISHDIPDSLQADQTYTFHVTMQNTNTNTWISGGNNPVRLGSQSPQDNTIWGTHRAAIPFDVVSGAQVTIPVTIKAPHDNGTYTFCWRMVKEGVTWFGDLTPPVAITVKQLHTLVQERAFGLWLGRVRGGGSYWGNDQNDWFAAKAELGIPPDVHV